MKNEKHRNDYDDMKSMLSITRKMRLNENTSSQRQLTPEEVTEEQENFKKAVTNVVEFENFIIYDNSIEWRGKLVQFDIDWVFDTSDTSGVYMQTNTLLQLREDTLETIQKLRAYFLEWSAKWGENLNLG